MVVLEFQLDVSYSQIAIFNSDIESPFNDWSDGHVNQGFAWREGSVSFKTINESGLHRVTVLVSQKPEELSPLTERAIEVPFLVNGGGGLEISAVTESAKLHIDPGEYQLRAEFLGGSNEFEGAAIFTFFPSNEHKFEIARKDDALNPQSVLITTAMAAI